MSDFLKGDTLYFHFTSRQFTSGKPFALVGSPLARAFEDGSATAISGGMTMTLNVNATGHNRVNVDTSNAAFETGKSYGIALTAGTVDGVTVTGEVIANFTLGKSPAAQDLANATDGLGALKTVVDLTATTADLLDKVGATTEAARNGEVSTTDSVITYLKQIINILVGIPGIVTLKAAAAPNSGVSLSEMIRAIYDDSNELQVDWVTDGRLDNVLAAVSTTADLLDKVGAVTETAAVGDPSTTESLMKYVKQIVNILAGTTGVNVYPAEQPPANGSNLAEVLSAIHADVTGLAGSAMRGTESALLASTTGSGLTDLGGMSTAMKAEVQTEANDALEANHLDHLLAVDYDPAVKPGVATALLNELIESDAGVSRYTANALEQAPSGSGPTAAQIVDEWETQSQADPTGFHVNVKEVNGTVQTANDHGQDLNAIRSETDKLTLVNAGTGVVGSIINEVENRSTTADLLDKLGAVTEAAATGDPGTSASVMQYVKQIVNILEGADGITSIKPAAAPASGVSLSEMIRAIYDDTNAIPAFPGNFNLQVISSGGAVDSLVQGFIDTTMTEGGLGRIANSFDFFFDITPTTTKTVEQVGASGPTAAQIVDEWETQSIADPTGFRVNVMEVNATVQTANDHGADLNAIKAETDKISAVNAGAGVAGSLIEEIENVAALVWDVDATTHQTLGTFGKAIGDPAAGTKTIYAAVVSDAGGASIGVDVVALKAETVLILADTGTTLENHLTDIKGTGFVKDTHSLIDIETFVDILDDGVSGNAKIATDVALVLVDTIAGGAGPWTTGAGGSDRLLMVDTTINVVTSQIEFTLTEGSADDDAYNNCTIVIEDAATTTQKAVGLVVDYTGATKKVFLKYDPGIFVMANLDKIYILAENALKSTDQNRQLDVTPAGGAGIDWSNIKNKAVTVNLSGTTVNTVTTNTDMRGTDSAALASVLGALADAAVDGDPTATDTVIAYVKQLVNVLVGSDGVVAYPTEQAPASGINLAEVLRAIHSDVTGIAGSAMRGTESAALASVCTEGRLSELDAATGGKVANQIDLIKTEADKIALVDAGAGVAGSVIEEIENRPNVAQVSFLIDTALDAAIAELPVAQPTATPSIRTGIMLMYMALRNKLNVQTSGVDALEVHDDAGTKITSKLLTDVGGDYTEDQMT